MSLFALCLLAVVVITLPGVVLGLLSGVDARWSAAASIPVSFGFYGLVAWATGALGVRYNLRALAIALLIAALLAVIWRTGGFYARRFYAGRGTGRGGCGSGGSARALYARGDRAPGVYRGGPVLRRLAAGRRRATWRPARPGRDVTFSRGVASLSERSTAAFGWVLPAAGIVLGSLALLLPTIRWIARTPHGMESIFQGWDVQWHANAVRWIDQVGIASPTLMGMLQNTETQDPMYYPSAWHAATYLLTALGGASPIAAVNVMGVVAPGVALPTSVALLAWSMAGQRGLFGGGRAGGGRAGGGWVRRDLFGSSLFGGSGISKSRSLFGRPRRPAQTPPGRDVASQGVDFVAGATGGGAAGDAAASDAAPAGEVGKVVAGDAAADEAPSLTALLATAIAPLFVGLVPALFWVLFYVGAWPYAAGVAMSGAVIALWMRLPHHPSWSFAASLAFLGAIQTHPSVLTIVVTALGLWWALRVIWRPAVSRARDLAVLAAAGVASVVIFLPQLLAGSGQTGEVAAFTATEDLTRNQAWRAALLMQTRHVEEFGHIQLGWLLLPAAVGMIALVVWRGNLWAPALYALCVTLTAHSLVPFGGHVGAALTAITNLHYNTGHRLVMPVVMLMLAACGVGIAAVIRLITGAPWESWVNALGSRQSRRWAPWTRMCAMVLSMAATLGVFGVLWPQVRPGAHWAVDVLLRDDRMVNDADRRAWDWLAKQPHAYEGYIMGEPADGNGWMYAYNGLPALIRHYGWPSTQADSATDLLFWRANLLGEGNRDNPDEANAIDTAAQRLNVKFFYTSPPNFWAFQPPNWAMLQGLWASPGATPVYRDEQVTIFAVNAAFTNAELQQMRAASPNPLPPLEPRLPLGAGGVDADSGGTSDAVQRRDGDLVFHRPHVPQQPGPGQLLEVGPNTHGGLLRPDAVAAGLGVRDLRVHNGVPNPEEVEH